jgi:hypothetical protein
MAVRLKIQGYFLVKLNDKALRKTKKMTDNPVVKSAFDDLERRASNRLSGKDEQ